MQLSGKGGVGLLVQQPVEGDVGQFAQQNVEVSVRSYTKVMNTQPSLHSYRGWDPSPRV